MRDPINLLICTISKFNPWDITDMVLGSYKTVYFNIYQCRYVPSVVMIPPPTFFSKLSLVFIVSNSLHLFLLTIFLLLPSSFLHLSASAAAGQPMGGGYGGQASGGARPSEQGSTGEK